MPSSATAAPPSYGDCCGRAGDPQPGGPPPGVRSGGMQQGFGSKPRTGQGHAEEFDD
ncbi:MAG TPA: hypothetical protein VF729_05035 [Solirubrobacterales bacterium]